VYGLSTLIFIINLGIGGKTELKDPLKKFIQYSF
jgi:hypothetical protein